jgi:tRNA pseudouridine13 synthase
MVKNDKDVRRQVHDLVRAKTPIFRSGVVRDLSEEGHSQIELVPRFVFGREKLDPDMRTRFKTWRTVAETKVQVVDTLPEQWPQNLPLHLHFTLFKENYETLQAFRLIGHATGLRAKQFQIAGIKDKRGLTTQRVSLFKVPAERVAQCNGKFAGLAVGDFSYETQPIALGTSGGNHFTLIFREFEGEDESVKRNVDSLASRGFLNYFGLQRFGTTAVPTHIVGRSLLLSEYEQAVDLILKERSTGSRDGAYAARRYWSDTKDAAGTLERMPQRATVERAILERLCMPGKANDFLHAIRGLPRNSRTLYLHSFQSYVFNLVLSRRISKYGCGRVIVGDLVLAKSKPEPEPDVSDQQLSKRQQKRLAKGFAPKDRVSGRGDGAKVVSAIASEEEAAQYTIHDVVLPLPGFSVRYPEGELGDLYHSTLSAFGISESDFKGYDRDMWLPGDYRNIVVRPSNVSYSIFHYSDPQARLVNSDLDALEGRACDRLASGPLRGLELAFTLPPGAYATMAMREVIDKVEFRSGDDDEEADEVEVEEVVEEDDGQFGGTDDA